ncbi:MAG: hypothetical protein WBX25_35090 [Rhodomicrobium sp.]
MRYFAIFISLLVCGGGARGQDGPLLQLDGGGHMAVIRGLTFTPDGKFLVSAADDKAIRVWDWRSGKTVRIFRGEVAPGDPGKLYALALSPDGKSLAVGGWLGGNKEESDAIRIYDFASGTQTALLKGHNDVVVRVAFSPDGRYLLSGSHDNTAIIWDLANARMLHRLQGHRHFVYGVGFSPDGAHAVTSSWDHDLRLWSVESGALLAIMTGHRGMVKDLSVAPDGRIASGDGLGEIRLWNVQTGTLLKTLARQAPVDSLSFSPDGKLVLAVTEANDKNSPVCNVYDTVSGRQTVTYKGHDRNVVVASTVSPDGHWAATGGGNNKEIHIWDLRTGERYKGADGQPLSLAGSGRPVWAVGFSPDGQQIGWGNSPDYSARRPQVSRGPLQYRLTLPAKDTQLSEPAALSEGGFVRAKVEFNGWSLTHRQGRRGYYADAVLDIRRDGRVLASIERSSGSGYTHSSYSFTPDGETIVSGGGNGVLAAYDRVGNKLGHFIGHEGTIWGIAPSPDGRYLLSGGSDMTIRLWNLKTRELLVTIFRGEDGEWVMWTPQGFYTGTAAGARLVGWQINRGPDHAAEYVTAAQLRQHLNRPDIVGRAIQLASAEAAVKEAPDADFTVVDLLARPVPRLTILAPEADATVKGGHAQVTVGLEATPDPVKLIRIHVNGRLVTSKVPEKDSFKAGKLTFDVPLAAGADTIAVAAENNTGETVASLSLTHKGEGDLDKPGTLYILAIGVDKYPNLPGKDLRYSGADAKAFAEAMEKRAGPLHEKVVKRLLMDGGAAEDAPTAANIRNAFNILRQAKENDTVMLFVAGHGVNEGRDFQFAPADAAWGSETLLQRSSVVPWQTFAEALTGAKGRRIAFLDTCHSGNSFNRRFLSEGYEANVTFYSSAGADQLALEDQALGGGHGLFTFALAEGVNGGARDGEGKVRADGLRDFLKTRVGALAAKLQHEQVPQYFRARDADNFVLARR